MKPTEHHYRVNEIFYSLQGEGFFTGTPAVFLRFSGCNRSCPFCDTAHQSFSNFTAAEIVEKIKTFPSRHLVITGGEPTLQLDPELIRKIKAEGFFIAIETNGSEIPPHGIDWITCSPKEKPWKLTHCHELKVVFTSPDAVTDTARHFTAEHHFLQPMFNPGTNSANTCQVIEYILKNPKWRLSLQTHRMLGIQ